MSRKRKNTKHAKAISRAAEQMLHEKFGHFLADISDRLEEARVVTSRALAGGGGGPVYAADLNLLGRHFLHGFVITNNSPAAGQIAWTDLNLVYKGESHAIANGSAATTDKYLWWNPATPTAMQKSATKPILPEGGVLLFMNEGGTARNMVSDTNASLPKALANDAVDSGAIVSNAVTEAKINGGAVTETKIGGGAVTNAKIGNGAVTDLKIQDNAVTGTKILNGAVGNAKIANDAVTDAKILNGAVTEGKIGDGAVTNGKIDDAAVDPTKMNVLRHFIF